MKVSLVLKHGQFLNNKYQGTERKSIDKDQDSVVDAIDPSP